MANRVKRWLGRIAVAAILVLLLIIAAVLLLPRLIGPSLLAARIGGALGRKVTVGSVSFSPLGNAVVRNLRVFGPAASSDKVLVAVPSVAAHLKILPLLSGRVSISSLKVSDASVTIDVEGAGRAAGGPRAPERGVGPAVTTPPDIKVERLEASNAKFSIFAGEPETRAEVVASLQGSMDLAAMRFGLRGQATVMAGGEQGDVAFALSTEGGPREGFSSAEAEVELTNVPLSAGSAFLEQLGYAVEGGRASGKLRSDVSAGRASSRGDVKVSGLSLKPVDSSAVALEDVRLVYDGETENLTSPVVSGRLHLTSPAGSVEVRSAGTAADFGTLSADVSTHVDLSALSGILSKVLGLSANASLAGTVDSDVSLRGRWPDLAVAGTTKFANLRIDDPQLLREPLKEDLLAFMHDVAVSGGGKQVEFKELAVEGRSLSARVEGKITDLSKLAMSVRFQGRGNLSEARALLGRFVGVPPGLRIAGAFEVTGAADGVGEAWRSTGRGRIDDLELEGGPLGPNPVHFKEVTLEHDFSGSAAPLDLNIESWRIATAEGEELHVRGKLRAPEKLGGGPAEVAGRIGGIGVAGDIRSQFALDLGKRWALVARLLQLPPGLSGGGRISGGFDASIGSDRLSVDGTTVVDGLVLDYVGAMGVPFKDPRVEVVHRFDVIGAGGRIEFRELSASGQSFSVGLTNGHMDVYSRQFKGDVSLGAQLGAVVPAVGSLLSLPPGMTVSGGAQVFATVSAGQRSVSTNGEVRITGIEIVGGPLGNQPLAYDEVEISHDVAIDLANGWLDMADLRLTSPVGSLNLKGRLSSLDQPAAELSFTCTADLSKVAEALRGAGRVPPDLAASGSASIAGSFAGSGDEGKLSGTGRIRQWRVSSQALRGEGLTEDEAGIEYAITYADRGNRLVLEKLRLDSPALTVQAAGTVSDLARRHLDISSEGNGRLERIAALLPKTVGLPASARMNGQVAWEGAVRVTENGFYSRGTVKATDVQTSGWPGVPDLQEKTVAVSHDVGVSADFMELNVSDLAITSSIATVEARGTLDLHDIAGGTRGEVSIDAELASMLPLAASVARMPLDVSGDGRLKARASVRGGTKEKALTCRLDATECALSVAGIFDKPKDSPASLDIEGALGDAITLTRGAVLAGPLNLSVTGHCDLAGPWAERTVSGHARAPEFEIAPLMAFFPALRTGSYAGRVAFDTSVSGTLGAPGLDVGLNADFDSLRLPSPAMGARRSAAQGGTPMTAGEKGGRRALALLRNLSGKVAAQVGHFERVNWEGRDVVLEATAHKGKVNIGRLSAFLDGAPVKVFGEVDLSAEQPTFDLQVHVKDLPLDKTAQRVSHHGGIFQTSLGAQVALHGSGLDPSTLSAGLEARAEMSLSDGVVAGMDAMPLLSIPGQVLMLLAAPYVRDYEFYATNFGVTLRNGVLHFDKAALRGKDSFDLGWEGEIGLDGRIRGFQFEMTPQSAFLGRMGSDGRRVMDFMGGTAVIPVAGTVSSPRPDMNALRQAIVRSAVKEASPELGDILDIIESLPRLRDKR